MPVRASLDRQHANSYCLADAGKGLGRCSIVPLPRDKNAVIDVEKVTRYLLNPKHPDNGGKAVFFELLGFRRAAPEGLVRGLRAVGVSGSAAVRVESVHGIKYIVDGELAGPSGRSALVRTVWIEDPGSDRARLVTACPLRR
jgi:filamentous hemagglutinin